MSWFSVRDNKINNDMLCYVTLPYLMLLYVNVVESNGFFGTTIFYNGQYFTQMAFHRVKHAKGETSIMTKFMISG